MSSHLHLRRGRWLRALGIAAIGVAVVFPAAGCGGDDDSGDGGGGGGDTSAASDESSAEDWANGLCTALTTWTTAIKDVGTSIAGSGGSEDAIKDAASSLEDATNTLVTDLKGLGRPDTEGGQEAQEAISTLASELETEVAKISSAVDDAGSGGVMAAVTAATTSLTAMQTDVTTAFSSLQEADAKGDLESAFKSASSCSALTG